MTKEEKKCEDMADVSELAHKRTIRDIRKLNKVFGLHHQVDCYGEQDCGDAGQDHSPEAEGTHYGMKAQGIYNDHYDHITNATGI